MNAGKESKKGLEKTVQFQNFKINFFIFFIISLTGCTSIGLRVHNYGVDCLKGEVDPKQIDYGNWTGDKNIILPFTDYYNVIKIKTLLNNEFKVPMIVDTGASGTVFEYPHGKKIGLIPLKTSTPDEYMVGYFGAVRSMRCLLHSFNIGGIDRDNWVVYFIPIEMQFRIGLIPLFKKSFVCLGRDFLGHFNFIKIDYTKKRIHLFDDDKYIKNNRNILADVPLYYEDDASYGYWYINFNIDDKGPFPAIIDTGASYGFLSSSKAEELGYKGNSHTRVIKGVGSYGRARKVIFKEIAIGNLRLKQKSFYAFIDAPDEAIYGTELSILGNELFMSEGYTIMFDLKNKRFIIMDKVG